MKITAFISRVTEQYRASEALVLPVEAQAARLGADRVGVREGGRHAVVFEAARGVQALVLQEQPAGLEAHVLADAGRRLQQGLPLADRDDLLAPGRRAAARETATRRSERIVAARPLGLEKVERSGRTQAVPVVDHVQQAAARLAGHAHLVNPVGRAARRRNASLKSDIGSGGDFCFFFSLGGGGGGGPGPGVPAPPKTRFPSFL